jgi:hypothetical protein
MLESFIRFARKLPADHLHEVEDALADIMANFGAEHDFTSEELGELDRRMQDSNPEYASDNDVKAIFSKPFTE